MRNPFHTASYCAYCHAVSLRPNSRMRVTSSVSVLLFSATSLNSRALLMSISPVSSVDLFKPLKISIMLSTLISWCSSATVCASTVPMTLTLFRSRRFKTTWSASNCAHGSKPGLTITR